MPVLTSIELLMLCLVTSAGVSDLATRRIPNRLLAAGWLAGLACFAALTPAPMAAIGAGIGGAALCLMLYLPFYAMRGMAAGDVKLIATVGLLAGPGDGLRIAVLSWCVGGAMGLAMMVAKGKLRTGLENLMHLLRPLLMRAAGMPAVAEPLQGSAGSMPYGLAIALGTIGVLWWRHR